MVLSTRRTVNIKQQWGIPTETRVISQFKDILSRYGISIIKVKRWLGRPISIIGILILVRRHIYTESDLGSKKRTPSNIFWWIPTIPLHWRHNGRDCVSNHQPHDYLLHRVFRRRSNKTSKLCVTGLCAGNSPVTGKFPAQMASNAENISIWWRHYNKCDGQAIVWLQKESERYNPACLWTVRRCSSKNIMLVVAELAKDRVVIWLFQQKIKIKIQYILQQQCILHSPTDWFEIPSNILWWM